MCLAILALVVAGILFKNVSNNASCSNSLWRGHDLYPFNLQRLHISSNVSIWDNLVPISIFDIIAGFYADFTVDSWMIELMMLMVFNGNAI